MFEIRDLFVRPFPLLMNFPLFFSGVTAWHGCMGPLDPTTSAKVAGAGELPDCTQDDGVACFLGGVAAGDNCEICVRSSRRRLFMPSMA